MAEVEPELAAQERRRAQWRERRRAFGEKQRQEQGEPKAVPPNRHAFRFGGTGNLYHRYRKKERQRHCSGVRNRTVEQTSGYTKNRANNVADRPTSGVANAGR